VFRFVLSTQFPWTTNNINNIDIHVVDVVTIGMRPFGGQPLWRTTPLEDNPFGGQPLWRTTPLEDYPFGGLPLWRITPLEDYPSGGLPLWRITPLEDYPSGGLPLWRITPLEDYMVQLDCGLVRTEGLASPSRSTEGRDGTEGRVWVGRKGLCRRERFVSEGRVSGG
jgi:hypothetical protein